MGKRNENLFKPPMDSFGTPRPKYYFHICSICSAYNIFEGGNYSDLLCPSGLEEKRENAAAFARGDYRHKFSHENFMQRVKLQSVYGI